MSAFLFREYGAGELGKDGYPRAWHESIKHAIREEAGHRCVRCGHPYPLGITKGLHRRDERRLHISGSWAPSRAAWIVATCELLEVLPITATPVTGERTVALDDDGIVRVWKPGDIFGEPGHVGISDPLAAEHEAAFGDYRSNRFAWILGDVRPLPEPVPATGRLGLWDWAEVVPA